MTGPLLPALTVLLMMAGCQVREAPATPGGRAEAATATSAVRQTVDDVIQPSNRGTSASLHEQITSDDDPKVRTYNTGDVDVWPKLDLPLVIKIEVPEVPEGLTKPTKWRPSEEEIP